MKNNIFTNKTERPVVVGSCKTWNDLKKYISKMSKNQLKMPVTLVDSDRYTHASQSINVDAFEGIFLHTEFENLLK